MDKSEVEKVEQLIAQKDWSAAKAIILPFLYDNPDDTAALALMGVVLTEEGDQVAAIKTLEYCASLGESSTDVLEALGCAYLRSKDFAKAELFLDKARTQDPLVASIWRNLGVLYSQTDRPKESKWAFLRSRELNPSDMLTLYALASIQLYFGELDEAKETLRELVVLDPPEELKRFAMESLARLSHMH